MRSEISEAAALKAAKGLQASIAGWTILYAIAVVAAYAAVCAAALSSMLPLWLAMLANMLLVYFAYTPLHEATHGNIARVEGPFGWLNRLTGFLVSFPMIHNFSLHQTTHLAHHKHTYDPAQDADHWVKGSTAVTTALRCFTIVWAHYRTGWLINRSTRAGRRALMRGAIENMLTLIFPAVLILQGMWSYALMLVFVPAILGSGILAFFFDYAVHYPKVSTDRYRRGRIYRARPWLQPIITVFYVAQNYHQIHHLFPWVPFYRYPPLFRQVEPLLREKGTPIIHLG
jgi:beta-carotene hydroxylase